MLLQCQGSLVTLCAASHLRCGSTVVQPLWTPTQDRGKLYASSVESCEDEGSAVWAERGERITFGCGEAWGSSGAMSHEGDAPSKPGQLGWVRERVCQCQPARLLWTISELLKAGVSSQYRSGLQDLCVSVLAAVVQGLFIWQGPCAVPETSPLQ